MHPQPGPYLPPPPKKNSAAKGCLIAAAAGFGGLVLIGAIGAAVGGAGDSGSAATPPAAASAPQHSTTAEPAKKQAKKPVVNGIGREYRDGKFAFTVTKVKKGVRRVGNEYVGRTAQGRFVLVYVTVVNIGKEARTFDSSSQKLTDTEGRQFDADSEATIVMGDESKAFLENINPGNGVHGILVFDLPAGVSLKSLELHDSPFSGGVKVPLHS
ncbi:DUF4352 domain-containing protein [Actinoallomurus spadix]|uniref:DUF4352 domain-containing protein n=1 Tax=Actinoallomurus spadix TaxID=79912 RepID=A0ABN0WI29_9ACTN|nr:DUF4352 domain-containing protein [Actinoallomurus spadix]MCO5989946.1 DUF4352 domain-containing protein [Actinoallomurus spadix]